MSHWLPRSKLLKSVVVIPLNTVPVPIAGLVDCKATFWSAPVNDSGPTIFGSTHLDVVPLHSTVLYFVPQIISLAVANGTLPQVPSPLPVAPEE
jgi:hypothetical protein